jgi:hypothetical protein
VVEKVLTIDSVDGQLLSKTTVVDPKKLNRKYVVVFDPSECGDEKLERNCSNSSVIKNSTRCVKFDYFEIEGQTSD